MYKWIKFPTTESEYFKKLENKKIIFKDLQKDNVANFVILIGKNGSGKTTLLNWVKKISGWWNHKFCIEGISQIVLTDNFDNCCTNNFVYVSCCKNNVNYCLELLPFDNLGLFPDEYNEETFSKACHLEKIFVNDKKLVNITIKDFYKKINEWDTVIEPKEKEYIFEADEIVSKNYKKLKVIKSKIEKKYFEKQKEMLNDLKNANKWLPENKKIDPHSIESDFQKIANEFGKVTNLYIYPNTENMNLNIKIKDNDKCNIISFENLSSGQLKLLLILFEIIEVRLFDKNKRLFLFIDEIENSFYPEQQEKFIQYLIELSKELNQEKTEHQFFITTHSPFILKNFLNKERVAILDMEKIDDTNEISDIRKNYNYLLLSENGKLSYDGVSYHYYNVITPSYYLSLFEKLKIKICQMKDKDDMDCNQIDDWLNEKTEIKKTIYVGVRLNYQTILVRLRHLLAHGKNNEEEYKYFCKNKKEFENKNETNKFYTKFNNDLENLLKENIELIIKCLSDKKIWNNN